MAVTCLYCTGLYCHEIKCIFESSAQSSAVTKGLFGCDLHKQVSSEAHQREEDVLEGGGQRQGLVAQGAQVSRLDGTDVALRRDGVVGKGISL